MVLAEGGMCGRDSYKDSVWPRVTIHDSGYVPSVKPALARSGTFGTFRTRNVDLNEIDRIEVTEPQAEPRLCPIVLTQQTWNLVRCLCSGLKFGSWKVIQSLTAQVDTVCVIGVRNSTRLVALCRLQARSVFLAKFVARPRNDDATSQQRAFVLGCPPNI